MAQHSLRMGVSGQCPPCVRRASAPAIVHPISDIHGQGLGAQTRFTLPLTSISQGEHSLGTPRTRLNVVCMAHPRRVAKVAAEMQRVISNMLITDEVLVAAVTPERAGGLRDLSALLSVTDVYVSRDLQVVKVYISIYSDEKGKQKAMNNLRRLEGYVRKQIGQKVVLRLTPEIRFEYDDALEEADLVERVIGEEDVARFRSELEAETRVARGWTTVETPAAGAADQESSGGFFDDLEGAEEGEEDPDEAEYVEFNSADVFKRPGPFDFMFQPLGPEGSQPQVRKVKPQAQQQEKQAGQEDKQAGQEDSEPPTKRRTRRGTRGGGRQVRKKPAEQASQPEGQEVLP